MPFCFGEMAENGIITKSPNKSCDLDPLPTWLDESAMSLCLKRATITPLLKRSGLDKEDMKICRPISNLPFISKRIEKVVERNIEEH